MASLEQIERECEDQFTRFLQTPTIKILMSQVKTESQDILAPLLKSAFEAGMAHGIIKIMESVMRNIR